MKPVLIFPWEETFLFPYRYRKAERVHTEGTDVDVPKDTGKWER